MVEHTFPITERPPRYPGGAQYGVRWNHLGAGYEASFSFYEGHNHLPLFEGDLIRGVRRFYPQLRLYGADLGCPFAVVHCEKSEAAYFRSSIPTWTSTCCMSCSSNVSSARRP